MACGTPCNCMNTSAYSPCTENLPCCEHCPEGAPCAYAMLFRCEHKGLDEFYGLSSRFITALWKDCLFDCASWSARVYLETCLDGTDNSAVADDGIVCFAPAGIPGAAYECGCDYALPTGHIDDDCDTVCIKPHIPFCDTHYLKPMHFGCGKFPGAAGQDQCGWHDWYGITYPCESGPDIGDQFELCYPAVWQLEILTSSYATLNANYLQYDSIGPTGPTGTPTLNLAAMYECTDWKCLPEGDGDSDHGNTFTITGTYPNEMFPWLPKHICVVPYSARWGHHCEDAADACACADAGWNNVCLDLNGFLCGSYVGTEGSYISLTRTKSGGFGPATITAPTPAPCGYFTAEINTTACDESTEFSLIFVVWCDGTDWRERIYCYNSNDLTTTLICDTTATITDTCPDGVRFTFDCGVISSSCCPDCSGTISTTCCPSNLLPTALNLTITGAYSASVALTWDAGTSRWKGSHSCGGCTLDYTLACTSGTTWTLTVRVHAGTICGGLACEANATGTASSCSPFSLTLTSTTGGICVCGAGAVTYTITL